MGAKVSRTDFEWVHTEEPHASRRKVILEKYPEIKKLYGYDPMFKWVVTGMVLAQLVVLPFIQNMSWPYVLILAYCYGGVINHSLMLAIHEIAHNLAFGHNRSLHNRLFGFFANLPIGIPISISFRKYHLEHHRYQGDEVIDVDLPTLLEAKLFCTTGGKLLWIILQPFFYSVRPLVVRPKPPTAMEATNLVIQLFFDAIVVKLFGWKVLGYLLIGSLLSMGIHPVAGHFISEHYMFRKGFETYSYYGPLNWITFNVGYHNEHHDFPAVPGSRLPEVVNKQLGRLLVGEQPPSPYRQEQHEMCYQCVANRKNFFEKLKGQHCIVSQKEIYVKRIASEFYDDLPQHHSWSSVIYDFITDPEIGPYARIKRKHYGLES